MSYDSLALRLVVQELCEALLGGTIRHIEQVNPHTFSFRMSRATETHWLTVSPPGACSRPSHRKAAPRAKGLKCHCLFRPKISQV